MTEEQKQFIIRHFETNFLDGDKIPCKAVTFTAEGALDVAEYFYELATQAERERCTNAVKEVMDNCVYGSPDMFDSIIDVVPLHMFQKAINLINNK